ncbi:MAG: acyl-CoA carboxylase subunit beta [Thermodesulfobacteriota bacterium]|nr:acyl-CoA carboxylase subunit beta [Thermodesulfobacteriota bacterium]
MEEMENMIKEVEKRKKILMQGGGPKEVDRQHSRGKLTARERLDLLLDRGSFIEYDLWRKPRITGYDIDKRDLPGDGVITGCGAIAGRPVYVYSQDFTVLGGSMASVHAQKIIKIMKDALKMRVPCIGLVDSGGVRIQDFVAGDLKDTYATIFYLHTILSGVVPQISLMMGPCAAGATYSPMLADFLFMVKNTSYMYIASPELIKSVGGGDVTVDEIGSPKMHAEVSGCSDGTADDDQHCLEMVRELLGFLPQNNKENPPFKETKDDPNRKNNALLDLVPANTRRPYDVRKVIREIADDFNFFEVKRDFARNMVVGFIRLGGYPVGVVANNPYVLGGAIDIDAADKHARFVRICDSYNVPLLFLVDNPAYLPGIKQERGGIIRHGAKILHAVSEATVPKITLCMRKGYGGGLTAMCPRPMGADMVLAWPTAQLGLMGTEGAVSIIYRKEIKAAKNPEEVFRVRHEEYSKTTGEFPFHAGATGWVDDIIDPRDTRSLLVMGYATLRGKVVERPWKKHGNIPL